MGLLALRVQTSRHVERMFEAFWMVAIDYIYICVCMYIYIYMYVGPLCLI